MSRPVPEEWHMRRKYFTLSEETVLELLNWQGGQGTVKLPVIKGLPKDAIVSAVAWDFPHDCFMLRVHHGSYPEQAPYTVPPIEAVAEAYKVVIIPEDKP